MANKSDTIKRLRKIFEKSVRERTGASFFLTAQEAKFVDRDIIHHLEVETGYQLMCSATGRGEDNDT